MMTDVSQETRALRDRVDELEEANRQLIQAFMPMLAFPREWGLSRSEHRLLAALYQAPASTYVPNSALHVAISGLGAESDPLPIIRVSMVRLRKKLRPHGLTIETVWGLGYRLPPASRKALEIALKS